MVKDLLIDDEKIEYELEDKNIYITNKRIIFFNGKDFKDILLDNLESCAYNKKEILAFLIIGITGATIGTLLSLNNGEANLFLVGIGWFMFFFFLYKLSIHEELRINGINSYIDYKGEIDDIKKIRQIFFKNSKKS